ncbi:MAG TPA: hypothetical protein VK146_08755, partial [Tabrizicola sp.]|nr:hypothetical protein [Tabrizicola sp.]
MTAKPSVCATVMNVFFAAESVAAATDHDQISNFRSFLAEMGRRGVPEAAIPQELQAVADLD